VNAGFYGPPGIADPETFHDARIENHMLLETGHWSEFNLKELFHIQGGRYRGVKELMGTYQKGCSPVVSGTIRNNGVAGFSPRLPRFPRHRITMAKKTDYSGQSFYQPFAFNACGSRNPKAAEILDTLDSCDHL